MKSTGVIRKIDELGRLVVPKEIRKNLNINDGEEVEIFVDEDCIILKKYYRLLSLKDKVSKYFEKIEKQLNYNIFLTDREKILLSLKQEYKFLMDLKISKSLFDAINERKQLNEKGLLIIDKENKLEGFYLLIPLIINADIIGSLIFFNKEPFSEKDVIIADIISVFIKTELQ